MDRKPPKSGFSLRRQARRDDGTAVGYKPNWPRVASAWS